MVRVSRFRASGFQGLGLWDLFRVSFAAPRPRSETPFRHGPKTPFFFSAAVKYLRRNPFKAKE